MILLLCGVFCGIAVSLTAAVDLASQEVFNAYFYMSNNIEVVHAGIRDAAAAKQHWLQHGIDKGLQACGSFHSVQYLKRYSDLTRVLGHDNYRLAVQHYLTNGIREHRLGYVEGGYGGRWTVSDHQHRLFVSASRRRGAAIDSLVWDNHEFINAWDHGRELQMAMNFVPMGECYNPTEAGGGYDGLLNTTHTQIHHVHAAHNTLNTMVHPAFWKRQHDPNAPRHCSNGESAINTEAVYHYPFSKNVTLGCSGVSHPCLHFRSSFTIAGNIPHYTVLQMEAPTGYLTGDFSSIHNFDHSSGHVVRHTTNRKPVVMSTPDGHHAMGVYAPPNQDTDLFMYYGTFEFPNRIAPAATYKWNLVFRKNALPAGSTHVFNYDAYICMGTMSDVAACMKTLMGGHQELIG